ncbi:MAG: sulfotransferase domain-containing protein [Deltaproteobacteria bacterium]|nr:sulfotransferase domain-containing protein [Deltaproteobacteria bacterium]
MNIFGSISNFVIGKRSGKVKKKLVIHCSHHRAGTVLLNNIFHSIAKRFEIPYQKCRQSELHAETELWMEEHSRVDFSVLNRPYIGSHIVRDPREIWVSGYFYHLKSTEKWLHIPKEEFGGRTYQETINALGQEEGILFELNEATAYSLESMQNWNYNHPNILEIKYEDIMREFKKSFGKIFTFYGLADVDEAVKVACGHNLKGLSNESRDNYLKKLSKYSANHVHSLYEPGRWRTYLNDEHKEVFKEKFGDLLIMLGYETDSSWN